MAHLPSGKIVFVVAHGQRNKKFQVRYTVHGGGIKLTRDVFTRLDTVRSLKQSICNQEGARRQGCRLSFGRTQMRDTQTLGDVGINHKNNGPVSVVLAAIGGGGGNRDDNKANEGELTFEAESCIKKRHYDRYKSFDQANPKIADNPHFVLTLDSLADISDNKENLQGANEINELKRLNNCIKTNQYDAKIERIRVKLAKVYRVQKEKVKITDIFYGSTNIGYMIWDFDKNEVEKIIKDVKKFLGRMKKEFRKYKKMVLAPKFDIPDSTDGSYHLVKTYHVSCASTKCKCSNSFYCKLKEHDVGGVVLYMKDGKTKWDCNGRSCKIGYIIVKNSAEVKKEYPNAGGLVHGATYQSVFGEPPSKHNLVGSGFGRRNGKWSFRSGVFNLARDRYHGYSSDSCMNEIEEKWVMKAVKQW